MKKQKLLMNFPQLTMAAVVLLSAASWAGDHGHGKGHGHGADQQQWQGDNDGYRFDDEQKRRAMDFYEGHKGPKGCPPGLAKKGNGCNPPGLVKAWQRGQPLPRDVRYYPLPPELSVRIGVPPKGYRYVQVAGDILLIAVGTSIVVDAIEDLMR